MFRLLIANNSVQDWTFALLTLISFVLVLHVVRHLVLSRFKRLAGTTDTVVHAFFVEVLSATRILLAAAIGLYLALHFLDLPAAMEKFVDRAFISLLCLQCGFWANRGLIFWLRHRFSKGEEGEEGARAMTLSLLSFLGRIALWVLVVLLMLDNMGLNVTALVASLGIGGVAIALAAQNILSDLFASVSISIDKPFVIGDFIIVDEHMGSVEHVGMKTTRVRSLSGEQIIFSNNDLLKSRIRNYKRMQERRAAFSISVTYNTAVEQLESIPGLIQEAIKAHEATRFDRAHFKSFGPSSLDFEAVYYMLQPDFNLYMDVQQAINLALLRAFTERGIQFAFPTQTLHVAGGLQLADSPAQADKRTSQTAEFRPGRGLTDESRPPRRAF